MNESEKKGLSRFSRELNRLKETKMIYGGVPGAEAPGLSMKNGIFNR